MTEANLLTKLGGFTVFGFAPDSRRLLEDYFPSRLALVPRVIPIGTSGCLFYYTSYGEAAESESAVALKLGVARSPSRALLSSQALLQRNIVKPDGIDPQQVSGNASLICLSKTDPALAVYQTLLSVSQVCYTRVDGGILCADNFRTLVALLDRPELNERAIPMHFLFRLAPGRWTYFKDVYSLCPGELLTWRDGDLQIRLVHDLQRAAGETYLRQSDAKASPLLFGKLKETLLTYLGRTPEADVRYANLLSGGVDSSLIQLALNQSGPQPVRSFTYAMATPGFQDERRYAALAQRLLQTDHTVVEVTPERYLDLLVRTIETVCHPSLCVETEPCLLALAEYMDEHAPEVRYCFAGHGADALFGSTMARKLRLLEVSRRIPGARSLLLGLAWLAQGRFPKQVHGFREIADMLPELHNPDSFRAPPNVMNVYTNVDLARRCFGDEALVKVLEYRRCFVSQYLASPSYLEQAHTIELLTWDYEAAVFGRQLFLAHHKEKLFPFLDQDMLRFGYSIHPDSRYIRNTTVKPLLKRILVQEAVAPIARNPKRGGTFEEDLFVWMKDGPLRERIQGIKRPGFLSQKDHEHLIGHPDPFLWELLILDIFQERVIDFRKKSAGLRISQSA